MDEEPMIVKYFRSMKKLNAATLHVKEGRPPIMRVGQDLKVTQAESLDAQGVQDLIYEILSEKQKQHLEEIGDVDFAFELEDRDRFRVNAYKQRGQITIVARRVQSEIPTFQDLMLPDVIAKAVAHHVQGLILVTGTTGCGKSTTLAALIGHINKHRSCSVITIEDPIEYVYADDRAVINQREIGIDTPDFVDALKHILRQDPDVILLGEMRDSESFAAGLSAAETGHLVFGTLHCANVAQTLSRMLEFFPPDREMQIRRLLSFNLRAVISQKLLPCLLPDRTVVPAVEVLLVTPMIQKLIQEARDPDIPDAIRADTDSGMQDFTQGIAQLINAELVDRREAFKYCDNPEGLQRELAGIVSKGGLVGTA